MQYSGLVQAELEAVWGRLSRPLKGNTNWLEAYGNDYSPTNIKLLLTTPSIMEIRYLLKVFSQKCKNDYFYRKSSVPVARMQKDTLISRCINHTNGLLFFKATFSLFNVCTTRFKLASPIRLNGLEVKYRRLGSTNLRLSNRTIAFRRSRAVESRRTVTGSIVPWLDSRGRIHSQWQKGNCCSFDSSKPDGRFHLFSSTIYIFFFSIKAYEYKSIVTQIFSLKYLYIMTQ